MVEFVGWDDYFKENPDYYPKLLEAGKKYQLKYQFPKPLDKDECQKSTIEFALSKLNIHRYAYVKFLDDVPAYNPVYEIYCKEYPLPIGKNSIYKTYQQKRWYWTDLYPFDNQPLVEKEDAFIGLAKRFANGETIGWFLGLVKVYSQYMNTAKQLGELSDDERMYVYFHPPFEFIEGMILLEGKLDESVIRQLKDYEKYYNKNILGKVITGRPRSDPEYWLEPARKILAASPNLTQAEIAERLYCDEKTFKINRKNAGFHTFQEFKDSVLKP